LPESQGAAPLPGVLETIVRTKREEVARLHERAGVVEAALEGAPPVRPFREALATGPSVALIAECKRRSPGAGPIRPDLDPVDLAAAYRRAGASALSVLTDERHFGGALEDLRAVRAAVPLPVLRKDFVLDPLQVREARAAGADAILLIVRILDDASLRLLHDEATALGMDVLVEVHDRAELERAVALGADLIGINNRDLSTFETRLDTTLALAASVPPDTLLVSESGIRTAEDVRRLAAAGAAAILVGESLLRSPDPEAAARALAGVPRSDPVAAS